MKTGRFRTWQAAHSFAAPFHDNGSAQHKRRHVAADGRADLGKLLPRPAKSPEFVQRHQRRRGIGAAPAKTAADGNALFRFYRNAARTSAAGAQNLGGSDAQIVGKAAVAGYFAGMLEIKRVAKRYRHHHRTQRMKTVRTLAENLKREIYLGERLGFHALRSLIAE